MSDYCKEHGSKTENCDPDCDELPKTGDTSCTRTDLVNKLVALSSRVVNDHGSYLNMNSGDDDLADMLAKAIAEIQGEGK